MNARFILIIQFTAEDFQSRSRDAHGRYVQALAGPNLDYIATTYGVIQDSVLNRFRSTRLL